MSEETPKEHRLYVVITTDRSWSTENVDKQVQELLIDLQDEDGPFEEVMASADPINEDTEMPDAVDGTLSLLDIYTGFLREKAEQEGVLEVFREGLEKLEHGVTDLKACTRCIKTIGAQQMPGLQVRMLDQSNLEEALPELLHALAHKLGLDSPTCATMDRDDLIQWIRSQMEPPPRTIN
jgi:hypothetical protein